MDVADPPSSHEVTAPDDSTTSFANEKDVPQTHESMSSRPEQSTSMEDSLKPIEDRISLLEAALKKICVAQGEKEISAISKNDDPIDETNLPKEKSKTDQDTVKEIDAALGSLPKLEVKINRLPFENWLKSKRTGERGKSVLDVAMQCQRNSAILTHERSADLNNTTDGISKRPTSKKISNDTLKPSSDSDSRVPVRLSINSHHILRELKEVTGYSITPQSNVIIPPFKVLVSYEKEISNRLIELERNLEEGAKEKAKEALCVNIVAAKSTSQDKVQSVLGMRDQFLEQEDADVGSSIELESQVNDERTTVLEELGEGLEDKTESGADKPCERCKDSLKKKCARDTVDHLRCLVEFIKNDLQEILEIRSQIRDSSLRFIAFEHLWHLFDPGDIILSAAPKREAYRVFHTENGRKILHIFESDDDNDENDAPNFRKSLPVNPFIVNCFSMSFDGQRFGPIQQYKKIQYYHGRRAISTLDVFPSRFADDEAKFLSDLVRRGKRFHNLTSALPKTFSHGKYSGRNLWRPKGQINSEVIIDFEKALEDVDGLIPPVLGVGLNITPDLRETFEVDPENDAAITDIDTDAAFDRKRAEEYTSDMHMMQLHTPDSAEMSDDHFMLLPEGIVAWVLRDRMWAMLDVDLVKDVNEEKDGDIPGLRKKNSGFEDLVLPKRHKALIESLVRTHSSVTKSASGDAAEDRHFDIIEGKGDGLVILLHGVPGVGKTSTAECVAAFIGRPLYPITCGDIGDTATAVEFNLTGSRGHLRYAQKWGCIMLLDDADVLFGSRQIGNHAENAVVSVFLRTLDYYSGILFLTTNRIGAFDEAFISRVHYSLYYPPLDETSTLQIWNMNIRRIKSSGLITVDDDDEEEIIELAKQHFDNNCRWNGRQIRNAFQTAIALADYDAHSRNAKAIAKGYEDAASTPVKPKLTKKAFRKILAASADFDDYMGHVLHEGSYGESASQAGIRYDEWKDKVELRVPRNAYSDKMPSGRILSDGAKRGKGSTGGDIEDKATKTHTLMSSLSDDDSGDSDELELMKRELEMLKRKDTAKSKEKRRKEKEQLRAEIERIRSEHAEESEFSSNSKSKL